MNNDVELAKAPSLEPPHNSETLRQTANREAYDLIAKSIAIPTNVSLGLNCISS